MKNNLFIISGPSGAGEDSIIAGLKKILPIEPVVTTTTRKIRPGETSEKSYYFISQKKFKEQIQNDKFLEWAQEYNDNYYGVTHEELNRVINSDKIGIWKIEYKGVKTAKKLFPGIIAIFINAPLNELAKRIQSRGGITAKYLEERIKYTKKWLKHKDIYDYEIINKNGELQKAIEKTANIIKKEIKIKT